MSFMLPEADRNARIVGILPDPWAKGVLWIATARRGLLRLDGQAGGHFQRFRAEHLG